MATGGLYFVPSPARKCRHAEGLSSLVSAADDLVYLALYLSAQVFSRLPRLYRFKLPWEENFHTSRKQIALKGNGCAGGNDKIVRAQEGGMCPWLPQ